MQNGADKRREVVSVAIGTTSTATIERPILDNLGERLVNVRAQVMTWDDRYCGWLPGGALSNVALYQRVSEGSINGISADNVQPASVTPKFTYLIYGERVEDHKVSLYCQLTKDLNYHQVMPTFHHWQIEEQKFGLKFMSTYEASKFHNRLQKAVEHLYRQSKSSSGESNVEAEDLEDDVFVPVDLPLSRAESWESGATTKSVPTTAPGPSTSLLQTSFPSYSSTAVPAIIHHPPSSFGVSKTKKSTASAFTALMAPTEPDISSGRPPGRTPTWPKTPAELTLSAGAAVAESSKGGSVAGIHFPFAYFQKETSSATIFTKPQQPSQKSVSKTGLHASTSFGQISPYPSRSTSVGRTSALEKRGSISSLKLSLIHQQPLSMAPSSAAASRFIGSKKISKSGASAAPSMELLRRERCFYCKNWYIERDNFRGVCPDAPDSCSKWLKRLTCLWCAECVLYCCCRDWTDGEAPRDSDICSCSSDDPTRWRRWTLLGCLALFLPCLWCYLPLSACHRSCRRRCRLFRGRHAPMRHGVGGHSGGLGTGRSSSAGRMSVTPEASSVYK